MPRNAIMAFCTFYKNYSNKNPKRGFSDLNGVKKHNHFDYIYNGGQSVLTRLRFKLKPDVCDTTFVSQFDIILYRNSVFLMSLKTNRLYTHEIIPSILSVSKIPVRMGMLLDVQIQKLYLKMNKHILMKKVTIFH